MASTNYKLTTEWDFDSESWEWVITQTGTNYAYAYADGFATEAQALRAGQRELDYILSK